MEEVCRIPILATIRFEMEWRPYRTFVDPVYTPPDVSSIVRVLLTNSSHLESLAPHFRPRTLT